MSLEQPPTLARLYDELSVRAGAEIGDVATLAVAISRIPYGRPSDLSPHGVVADWRGTCSTKHLLFQAMAEVCEPAATVDLVHRVYRVSPDEAEVRWGPVVGASVPPDGLVDVHTFARLGGNASASPLTVDVTFPIAPWDGRTPLPIACNPGDDIPAGDDLLGEKAELVARHCDPAVREPFIAALSRHFGIDPAAAVESHDVKWPATPYRAMRMTRLGEDEWGTWLWAPRGTMSRYAGQEPRVLPVDFLTLVPADAWWRATWMFGSPIELYVDIGAPAEWTADDRLRVVDLDLDVIRWRDGRCEIDDEDEFAEHAESLRYPPELVANARRTAGEVLVAVRAATPPFGAAPAGWLR